MRLKRAIIVIVMAQLLVGGITAAFTYMDYHIERDQLIMGDLLTLRLMTLGKEYNHSFRSGFYDAGLGLIASLRTGRTPDVIRPDFAKISERTVEVSLLEDLNEEIPAEITDILSSPKDVVLHERGSEISVAAKLYRAGEKEPYGVIRIVNTPRGLMRQVIRRNLLIYLLIFLLVNGQAALYMALITRRRDVVFQRGYLKEHALGALKLQHKILGDIIADHDEDIEEDSDKVVPFPKEGR